MQPVSYCFVVQLLCWKTLCRVLYPKIARFLAPPDSDYDNQSDFEPVDTALMPLTNQDPKLQYHYAHAQLPEFAK